MVGLQLVTIVTSPRSYHYDTAGARSIADSVVASRVPYAYSVIYLSLTYRVIVQRIGGFF